MAKTRTVPRGGDYTWPIVSFLALYLCGALSVIGFDALSVDLTALQSTADMLGMFQSDSPSADSASAPASPRTPPEMSQEPSIVAPSPMLMESTAKIPIVDRKELKFIFVTQTGGDVVKEMATIPPHRFGRSPEEPGYRFFEDFRHVSAARRRKYDWFFVVRDPVDRFLSWYACCSKAVDHTVEEFNDWLQKNLRSGTKGAFTRMTDYVDPDYAVLQHVIRFENLETDLRHLLPFYNFSLAMFPAEAKEVLRFGRQDISEETMNFIRTYYMGDFVSFNYSVP
ncbi:cya1 [Symbiodinium natans]|uniref:Cya1 protein n=1 Tax=Symbiodinium natans TaxID=878477 RepID=A0A812UKF0_9DINO|nr:cya1 [Symbiodinium natans]